MKRSELTVLLEHGAVTAVELHSCSDGPLQMGQLGIVPLGQAIHAAHAPVKHKPASES